MFVLKDLNGKITMLTAYDFPTARIIDEAGIDFILVGDSLAMTMLGMENTKNVGMQEMLHHTKAVVKAVKNAVVVGDMPAGSYSNEEIAKVNAGKFKEIGVEIVKIEGCRPEIVKAIQSQGLKVMGHLGLLPQTAENYKVQGRKEEEAERILKEAKTLDGLGLEFIVLECIPIELAKKITEEVNAKTIGIGAGPYCNGQVLVIHDLLGLGNKFKFVKQYADLSEVIGKAVSSFIQDVKAGEFPKEEHSFK